MNRQALLITLVLVFAGCSPLEEPEPLVTEAPTELPLPTDTTAPTDTPEPTSTPRPTSTPDPEVLEGEYGAAIIEDFEEFYDALLELQGLFSDVTYTDTWYVDVTENLGILDGRTQRMVRVPVPEGCDLCQTLHDAFEDLNDEAEEINEGWYGFAKNQNDADLYKMIQGVINLGLILEDMNSAME